MKNLKKEDGAVSVIVFVSILFFITILSGVYVINSNARKSQLQMQIQLKSEYAESLEPQYMKDLYDKKNRGSSTLLEALKNGTVKIGDYVNYVAPEISDYTISSEDSGAVTTSGKTLPLEQVFNINQEQSEQMGWQILGYGDKEGNLLPDSNGAERVLLIAANPIQQYLSLGGAKGCINGQKILNELCSKFATEGNLARCINMEDINTALGIEIVLPEYDENGTLIDGTGIVTRNGESIGEIQQIINNQSNEKFHNIAAGEESNWDYVFNVGTYTYREGDYAIINGAYLGKLENGNTNIDTEITNNDLIYYAITADDTVSHMLLDGTDGIKPYWIDTKGVLITQWNRESNTIGGMEFGLGGVWDSRVNNTSTFLNTIGEWNMYTLGIRPIIVLNSNIKFGKDITQSQINKTSQPENWNTVEIYENTIETVTGQYE